MIGRDDVRVGSNSRTGQEDDDVKRFFIVSSVLALLAFAAEAASGSPGKHFWGLWEAIGRMIRSYLQSNQL